MNRKYLLCLLPMIFLPLLAQADDPATADVNFCASSSQVPVLAQSYAKSLCASSLLAKTTIGAAMEKAEKDASSQGGSGMGGAWFGNKLGAAAGNFAKAPPPSAGIYSPPAPPAPASAAVAPVQPASPPPAGSSPGANIYQ
jgi:hypothetical protein